jgi:pimeloyl-ACP methyl ester carboxylesterase
MATFVLIHGAGDVGWYWHLVEAELRERGHDVVAPDLPYDDDSAGLSEYADAVVDAIGDRTDLVAVAQSLGAFTAPLVCDRVAVDLLVLVAPMIPAPGEAPADYWTDTRYEEEVRELVRRRDRPVLPGRSSRVGLRGARTGKDVIRSSDARAVAARGLARRAHAGPARSRRPPVPGPLRSPRRP